VSAAALALAASMPATPAGAVTHHERPVFRPPVDAPVTDPFRPPEDPYGPGNRGIEYDTEPGEVVRAAASGGVEFAGAVAGTLHVTVDHGGGLVSSYSYLQRLSVRVGAAVARGAVIGIAGERLHFGVRLDGTYADPDTFIGVRRVRVRLVPLYSWRR
jgi:murein DD-endopeptidase MepM/ murein hydrolase activator NlpD